MLEGQTTLTPEAAPSPAMHQTPDELISTIDEQIPSAAVPDVQAADDKQIDAKPEDVKIEPPAEKQKLDRFDKQPRFQELRAEIAALKSQIESQASPAPASPEKATKPFLDGMKDDDILDSLNEKPGEFVQNLEDRIYNKVRKEFEAKQLAQSEEQRVTKTLENYVGNNSDFDEKWESGEIKKFMEKNPGHNAISAHMTITQESKMKDAIEAAEKKGRDEALRQVKAKHGAQVLGAGPSSGGFATGTVPPEMKDSKKYGGKIAVMAARLATIRREAG